MELKDLPVGTRIFVDTNIFLYAISDHPQFGGSCNAFFDRVKVGEIHGEISVIVLNELIHKLIIAEIADREGLRPMQVLRRVKADRTLLLGCEIRGVACGSPIHLRRRAISTWCRRQSVIRHT